MEKLKSRLKSISRRMTVVTFVRSSLRLFFYGLVLTCAVILASKFFHIGEFLWYVIAGIFGLVFALGAARAILKKVTLFDSAIAADEALEMKERLSSAILLERDQSPAAMACCKDACSRVEQINVKRCFPFRIPGEFKWAFIPALVAVMLWFCPVLLDVTGTIAQAEEEKIEKKEILKEASDLDKEVKKVKKKVGKLELRKDLKEVLREIEEFQEYMKKKPGEKKKLLKKAGNLESKLKDALKNNELDKLSRSVKGFKDDNLKNLKSFTEALKRKDLDKAREEWKKIEEEWKKGDDAKKEEIARELSRLSRHLKKDKGLDPEMAEAMRKLSEALKGLSKAAGEDEKVKLEQEAQEISEDAKKALEKLLKDKEALKKLLEAIKKAKQGMG